MYLIISPVPQLFPYSPSPPLLPYPSNLQFGSMSSHQHSKSSWYLPTTLWSEWTCPSVFNLPVNMSLKKTYSPSPRCYQTPIIPQVVVSLHTCPLLLQLLCYDFVWYYFALSSYMPPHFLPDHMFNCPNLFRKCCRT